MQSEHPLADKEGLTWSPFSLLSLKTEFGQELCLARRLHLPDSRDSLKMGATHSFLNRVQTENHSQLAAVHTQVRAVGLRALLAKAICSKKQTLGWVWECTYFNPHTQEAEAGGSL